MEDRPIRPYVPAPVAVAEWDPRSPDVAARLIALIEQAAPGHVVEHVGSSAVPGLIGKGIIDLVVPAEPEEIPGMVDALYGLGFGPQQGPAAWPPTRPMLVGQVVHEGTEFQVHLHIVPPERDDFREFVGFRDALRDDPALRDGYVHAKTSVLDAAGGPIDGRRYSTAKSPFVEDALFSHGIRRVPADRPVALAPGATIGILGGGQLGRMLGLAARTLGYRIAVLDPDAECPAAAVADEVVVGGYDDIDAALRLAERADVVTYELEHISVRAATAVAERVPVRPGIRTLQVTQDRLAERRFLHGRGEPIAPWRAVSSLAEVTAGADALGFPLRLKAAIGGYDGRSQVRIAGPDEVAAAFSGLGGGPERPLLLEQELAFETELSVTVARDRDGRTVAFPVARNVHDQGSSSSRSRPRRSTRSVVGDSMGLAGRLARGLDVVGLLTVELFLLPGGRIFINELAPRVHNSGHWTIEGAVTSPVRAARPRDLRPAAGRAVAAWADRDGQPPRQRRGPSGAAGRLGGRAARRGRACPRVRQAPRVRAPEDGPRDGHRTHARRGAGASPHGRPQAVVGVTAGPVVGVVGGSRSDFPILEKAVAVLDELEVVSELRVVSAHRTPDHLFRYAETAAGRGLRVIIAGAGGAAHLPGMLAAKTTLPVIGVPIPTQHLGGLDSLLSIVQMPRGIPVATVAIGNAENAALLAAAILALSDQDLAMRLAAWRARQTDAVMSDESNAESLPSR